uniref:Decapping nuclease n=1 Tax=Panagrolaimus superbus TaxID=310955 RepID=A0A914Y983_9BILA
MLLIKVYNNVVEIKLQKGDFASSGKSAYLVDKLRKWYFQSQLVNSDTVVVGFRNNNIVNCVKKIKTHDLSLFLKPEHRWHQFSSYSATITILSSVCKFYEENVKENQTLVIELPPNKSHILYHIRDDIIQNMLPKEFKKAFEDDDVHEATTQPVTKQGHILRTEKAWMDDCIEKACV